MSHREADEFGLLACATALAIADGRKAGELGFLAGFLVAVGDVLALLAVIAAEEETRETEKKAKEDAEKLDKRLERIEEQLKALEACCQAEKQQ